MATFLTTPTPINKRRGKMDEDGYREYWATFVVQSTSTVDGPSAVLATPGLPTPGDKWIWGNDIDLWAYATLERSVEPIEELGPSTIWHVEIKYSSKPKDKRCKDNQIDDPLLMADRVSGGSQKYTREATSDRFGNQLVNSAYEQIRGQQVEFDANRFTITIEQNVLDLQLFLLSTIVGCVNDSTLWGMPRRKVKLSDFDFSVKYYGDCYKYYTRKLVFEIDPLGFDRDIADEGTKCINGQWGTDGHWQTVKIGGQNPNPLNPAHYTAFTDRKGQPAKVVLDGKGKPFDDAPTIITGCSTCSPDGSVQTWTLKGYVGSAGAGYSEVSFDMTYTSGCTWSGTYNAQTYTLTYTGGNWVLSVGSGLGLVQWTATGASWNCLWPNTLKGTAPGTVSYPGSWITYAKRASSSPGTRHVEKYNEANFLILGIPTSL